MMHITELSIKGYRSLKDVTWRPGNLNVIIGPNASGKSNLLQVLQMLAAAAEGRLNKFLLNEGGLEAVLWDDRASDMAIDLTCDNDLTDPPTTLFYDLILKPGGIGTYTIKRERFRRHEGDLYIHRMNDAISVFPSLYNADDFSGLPATEAVLSLAKSPFFGNPDVRAFEKSLAAHIIYSDVRTDKKSEIRTATVARVEKQLDSDGQNLVAVLHTLYNDSREFKNSIRDAMTAAFGEEFEDLEFPPASDQRIQLRIRWKSLKRTYSTSNLSDGTLRFLFLITALAQPDPPSLIAIDEPETGLHPSMMRIVAAYAEDAALRTQVVMTTHSAQFLDGFSRETPPTTTVATLEDGATVLKTLDAASLRYWLNEYSLGTLQRTGELEQMDGTREPTPTQEAVTA